MFEVLSGKGGLDAVSSVMLIYADEEQGAAHEVRFVFGRRGENDR